MQHLGGKGRRIRALLPTYRLHSEFKARLGYRDCPRPYSCFLTQGS